MSVRRTARPRIRLFSSMASSRLPTMVTGTTTAVSTSVFDRVDRVSPEVSTDW